MENLTKENFWNEMTEKYPKAMNVFCNWIDKYKEENKWGNIFNDGYPIPIGRQTSAPRYHDLPLAMQMGIWCQFQAEYAFTKEGKSPKFQEEIFIGEAKRGIVYVLEQMNLDE